MTFDLFTTRQPSHQPGHPFAAQQLRALAEEFDAQAAATRTSSPSRC